MRSARFIRQVDRFTLKVFFPRFHGAVLQDVNSRTSCERGNVTSAVLFMRTSADLITRQPGIPYNHLFADEMAAHNRASADHRKVSAPLSVRKAPSALGKSYLETGTFSFFQIMANAFR